MKADLRLTPEHEKNWSAFETAVVDMWKKQAEQQIAWRNAHAKEQGSVDLIDEMRKDADDRPIECTEEARRRRSTALQQSRRSAKAPLF